MRHSSKIEQVEQDLLKKLTTGDYVPHERFFSVNELKELYSVSQATITRVLEKLEASGYLYRLPGQGTFVSPQSKVRQILIVSSSDRVASPEHNSFSYGVESICTSEDLSFIPVEISEKDFLEKYKNIRIIYKNLYAVIFFRSFLSLDTSREFLEKEKIFYLYYGALSTCGGGKDINHYCYDDRELIWTALDILYKKGHRKIGCLYADYGVFSSWHEEYMAWMVENGLYIDKNYIFKFSYPEEAYSFLVKRFKDKPVNVSAFLCITNYFIGTGTVQAMLRLGISIPKKIAVIGIGNEVVNKQIYPNLSSVSMDITGDTKKIMKMLSEIEKSKQAYEDIKFYGRSKIIVTQGETV